ncbi:unnamed protein product [Effrenium voratum]|nr:unnamed protein product [Effrenium voratum]
MGLIFELGKAYAEDEQWDRCCNVMLRGFKRVSELKSEEDRFDFLAVLSQASMHLEKYRQALAVINDMTDPTDPDSLRGLNIMRCQVHCSTGDMQKGLKAFNAAIEGASFQEAVKAWAGCSRALKQVNAWMVTKNSIAKLTHTEEEKKQLESIDKLCELKDEVHKIQSPSTVSPRQYLGIFVLLVILFCGLALLYVAEQRSLAKMEWRK